MPLLPRQEPVNPQAGLTGLLGPGIQNSPQQGRGLLDAAQSMAQPFMIPGEVFKGNIDPLGEEAGRGMVNLGLELSGMGSVVPGVGRNALRIGGNPLTPGPGRGKLIIDRKNDRRLTMVRPIDTRSGQTGRVQTDAFITPRNTMRMDLEFGVDDLMSIGGRRKSKKAGLLQPRDKEGLDDLIMEEQFFPPNEPLDQRTLLELLDNGKQTMRRNMINLQPEIVQYAPADVGLKRGLTEFQEGMTRMLVREFGGQVSKVNDVTIIRFPKHKKYPKGLPSARRLEKTFR